MAAFPQLAGKNLVEKTFKKAVPPESVTFEVSGSNPEIREAHMDDAMLEETISQLMDIFMIVEYKKSMKIGTQEFDFDEFMHFVKKTRMLQGYSIEGVQRTRIKCFVNQIYHQKVDQFMDLH